MLYVYTRRGSNGARDLTEGLLLNGVHARRTKGQRLQNLQRNDAVICWGDHFAAPVGVKTLNNVEAISKFREVQKLTEARVPTVQVSRTRPNVAPAPAPRPAFRANTLDIAAGNYTPEQLEALLLRINPFIVNENARRRAHEAQPAPVLAQPVEDWLPRRNNHIGGSDLLHPDTRNADFWSKKEDVVEEYRVHMFRGKSIRAGKKVQVTEREGRRITPHQWIRSYDAGWIIQYDGFNSTKEMRKLASNALKALGLDFGAVDIGKKRDGSLIVFEVNRAPGIEGNSITAYAKHVQGWLNGEAAGEE